MSYYGSNYPPGVSTSDLPGWQRPETQPEPREEIHFFPINPADVPESVKAARARIDARLAAKR